jgi:lysozyme-like protein
MPRIRSMVIAGLVLVIALAGLATAAAANASTSSYSCAQLGRLWLSVGGGKSSERIAEGVAMAESGGYQYAVDHDSNGTVDRGLWQINSVHGHWSSYNVTTNARAAKVISDDGRNWRPWVTYMTGAYRLHCGA